MLRRGKCEGCHASLSTVDLNTIRSAAPDEVVRCEECRRILVRSAESEPKVTITHPNDPGWLSQAR
jgi:predicted  nucleic acid-binding Zn-ribbon protein